MDFHVLTLFPEMINQSVNHSILKRAISNKLINVNPINIAKWMIHLMAVALVWL
jgi:tRNA (guanine37-N1)-methyltransferase